MAVVNNFRRAVVMTHEDEGGNTLKLAYCFPMSATLGEVFEELNKDTTRVFGRIQFIATPEMNSYVEE